MRGKLHFGVLRIVVPDEASNKPHNDHFRRWRGESCWKRRRQAAAELNGRRLAAARRNNCGINFSLASFHATALLTMS
jgi:hypothetical protein